MDFVSLESLKPTELPSPPQGTLNVVHACTREKWDAQQLSSMVAQDPVLSVEILRIANSAYFGFASEITSVARAITVIGQNALRNIALCIAMRDALKPDQLPAFPVTEFWEAALRRAVCGRSLAVLAGLDGDTCFTAGLLQDFGLLVLFYLKLNRISEWPNLARLPPDRRRDLELQLFGMSHDKVGLQLARSWGFPEELEIAIGFHHETPPQQVSVSSARLAALSCCVDWMASVFTADDKRHAIQTCRGLLADQFELSAEQADRLLEEVASAITEAAGAYGFEISEQPEFDSLMRNANLRLVEENLSVQEMNWHLQQIIEERDRVTAELNRELELAREVQRSLLPSESDNPLGLAGVNVSAKAVSGDFYDFFQLHNGQIAFCIADVAGKGMNAALLMAKASSLFHCLGKSIHDPSKLLAMLNHEIAERSIQGMFVTMVAGLYNPQSGRVRLANAGHPPVIQMSSTQQQAEYPATAPPLGVVTVIDFPSIEFQLGNDSLYLYTDGLIEARISGQQRLEQQGLITLFSRYAHKSPQERLQRIVAEVRRGQASSDDDITLLLVERQESEEKR